MILNILNRNSVISFLLSLYILLPFFSEYLQDITSAPIVAIYGAVVISLVFFLLISDLEIRPVAILFCLAGLIFHLLPLVFFRIHDIKFFLNLIASFSLSMIIVSQKRYDFTTLIPLFLFYLPVILIPFLVGGFEYSMEKFAAQTRMAYAVNPISLSFICCICFIAFYFKRKMLLDYLLLIIPLFGLAVSASKGPVLSIALVFLLSHSHRLSYKTKIIIFSCVGAVALLFLSYIRGDLISAGSVGIRGELYVESMAIIMEHWFLTAGLSLLYDSVGIAYPHNLIIDVWLHSGFLSLIFLLVIVFCTFATNIFYYQNNIVHRLAFFLIFVLMFSFPYLDMIRILYPLSILSLSIVCFDKKKVCNE